ncbi:trifunctional purine biosynthetic protein adenosine-3-like [Uloborus diversus]|uniref:trifunctional purine biosynthetic protein adenosine-3-like n=1 Tax=Uloborus diversus TaxID=327109 RepID=UPI0024096CF2|nr:trifunctional purine biosynthetic protein adenosine-3-like [Uloborus diversus]
MADLVLVIGSGGREHALAWKLSQSPNIEHIYVAPGNAGTHSNGDKKVSNCALNVKNHSEVVDWCKEKGINFVVVGPEDPLANGLADYLAKNGIKCFGPCQRAAQIEASKEFAKVFMDKHEIPTARWKSFTDPEEAKKHVMSASYNALVVKASGLAAGKGVIVGNSRENAAKAIDTLKQDKGLSSASEVIVIEELLEGEEVSVLGFCDGSTVSLMPPAQDHKRLGNNDEGPNTGGMGAYCRCPLVSDEDLKFIETNIMQKAVDGMKSEGSPYIGVLYAGLMMTKDGPKVLEFNCRFGDPETQVILPLIKTDLYSVMKACVAGKLNTIDIQWSADQYAVGVVLVSGGYPGGYPKGKIISGLHKFQTSDLIVFHAGTSFSSGNLVTSGGRVLAVVALSNSLEAAAENARKGATEIHFDGVFFRNDIAQKALKRSQNEGLTYKSSGVDIKSADDLIEDIKKMTKQTLRSGVCGGIGGFGGIFDLKAAGYIDPYLVSRGRGISGKMEIAQECGQYELIGNDLVAACVNEIICHGAEPLFFLDTYTCGKLDVSKANKVIAGIARACELANCALIGGETAEMPGMYADGDFDLTAFARGAVERSSFLPRKKEIHSGDAVIGLCSSVINVSGYDLVDKVIKKQGLKYDSPCPDLKFKTFAEYLMRPTKIYVHSILPLMKKNLIKAAAYIDQHGLHQSISNILDETHKVVLDASKWEVPFMFNWIATNGHLSEKDMLKVFNMGLDMILIVDKDCKDEILENLKRADYAAFDVGFVKSLQKGTNPVEITNLQMSENSSFEKKNIGVLASCDNNSLRALIKFTENSNNISAAKIKVVVSNTENNADIDFAQSIGIPVVVVNENTFTSKQEYENAVHSVLEKYRAQIVCIDGSINVSDSFIGLWKGKLLKSYPTLVPAFDGADIYKQVLDMKVRITGCSICFVEPENKQGAIVEQAAISVDADDTIKVLREKILQLEQHVYTKALELVASGKVTYNTESRVSRLDDDSHESPFVDSNIAECIKLMQPLVEQTKRSGFVEKIGSSCGIFDLEAAGYQFPYLVSGTDGVGTKLKIAQICNKHDSIGIDLVAMCVNDILTHGAEPLFFMQCFDCGKANPDVVPKVVSGIVEGCKQANCSLIGSELSQVPDVYLYNKHGVANYENYDVVGYAEGALIKSNLLPKSDKIQEGDVVIGMESSGIHSNGFSLVRKLVELRNLRYKDPAPFDKSQTLGEALLVPTKIYVQSLLPLMKKGCIKAAAHITGGGIVENIPRVLPATHRVVLDATKWTLPNVMRWIAKEGCITEKEMLKTFNCGIGMALIVSKDKVPEVLAFLKESGETASVIGEVQREDKGKAKVEVQNFCLSTQLSKQTKKRVGVLISGSGTNLQALIDYTQNPSNQSRAEIVLVVSNKAGVEGLKRAEKAKIPTKVINHKDYSSRVEFDMAMHAILQENKVEIVCLAGFMRILSKEFVRLWEGKLLNVHPAILPAFKGMNAHKLALEAGARISGCTVHFVEPEVDAGAIIEQASVRVAAEETEKSLQEKVKVLEHEIFPKALELLCSGRVSRKTDGKIQWHY